MVKVEERRRDHDPDDRRKDRHRERDRDGDRDRSARSGKEYEKDASHDKARREDDGRRSDSRRKKAERNEDGGDAPSSMELEERIRRTREERLKKDRKAPGPIKSLAEQDEGDDLLGWVQKSKQLEEKRRREEEKARAAATARRLAEAEAEDEDSDDDQYDARHLAGLKVAHGLDKVMEGGAIVLTLKDTRILDERGDDVNDAGDELENVEIIEQKRRDDARKAAKKGNKYDEKFDEEWGGAKALLPQYDELKEQDGVVLDAEGGLDRKRMEEIQRKLAGAAAAEQGKESLLGGGQRVAAEYFTQEEMDKFKRPKEKKKKKLRKREKLDLDAMEEEAKAAGLGATDKGSRATRNVEDVEKERRKGEAAEREAAYVHALDKAETASRALKEEAAGAQLEEDDEEDDELVQSLERARQAALKAAPKGVEAVASRAIELAKKEPVVKPEPETDSGLVFTSTGEFVRGISLEETVRKEKNELFDDEDEEMKDAEEAEAKEEAGGWMEVTAQGGEKEEEEDEKLESISEEVVVGTGVAGALKLLQQRGALSDSVDWGGRNMDKKKGRLLGVVDESLLGVEKDPPKAAEKEEWPKDVQLIRHDRFGRVMTPKEAWRELNHHFHGMYPSKNKKEKEFKQFMEEKKLKQMNPGDTPAGSVQKMRDVQAKTASPYIVLSGSVKPGQTSDFRSGFAVAEKETFKPGELTPMLGDQKVQKFLGTKRKEGAGDMGPPPPKKPKM